MITEAEMDEMKLKVRETIRLFREEYEKSKLGDRLDAKAEEEAQQVPRQEPATQ